VNLGSELDAGRITGLAISSSLAPAGDAQGDGARAYRSADGLPLSTRDPVVQAAIGRLGEAWPKALPMRELLDAATGEAGEAGRNRLADFALTAFCAGLAQLHVGQPAFTSVAREKPVASALARLQASEGPTVTGGLGNTVALDDALGRRILVLLDGTRDRTTLMRESGADAAQLERCLAGLARCALLR
jgi:hypothetical protein